jgi:hypothetical protein
MPHWPVPETGQSTFSDAFATIEHGPNAPVHSL